MVFEKAEGPSPFSRDPQRPGVCLLVRCPGAELHVASGDEGRGVLDVIASTGVGVLVHRVDLDTAFRDLVVHVQLVQGSRIEGSHTGLGGQGEGDIIDVLAFPELRPASGWT